MNKDSFEMPRQHNAKLASEQNLPSGNKTEKTSAEPLYAEKNQNNLLKKLSPPFPQNTQ